MVIGGVHQGEVVGDQRQHQGGHRGDGPGEQETGRTLQVHPGIASGGGDPACHEQNGSDEGHQHAGGAQQGEHQPPS